MTNNRDKKLAAIARTVNSDGWRFYEEYLEERKEGHIRNIVKDGSEVDKTRGCLAEIDDSLDWAKEKREYKIK